MTKATGAELRQFIEQIEIGEADKGEAAQRVKEIYAEAKARGYDAKVLRKVVARRKRERDDLAEEEAVLQLYEQALEGN